MTMNRYLLHRVDGGVEIMETEIDPLLCIAKWHPSRRADLTGVITQIAESDVPTDRTFRNAWEDNAGVKVNMPKAREIHKAKLREIRKPKMEVLDTAYMRADEDNDTAEKRRIAALKQALRDVTSYPAIEAAQTPEELKAVMPAALRD